ncbi:hypothetical protein [Streptomyces sp. NPDC059466]|uniref:hypothetical protein n=1 Tax=unclassified Streptomyces TaxID=2593676 RepID=UPI0036A63379
MGILRHAVRRPLLIVWLAALAVTAVVAQSWIPDPWSGLIYIVILPAGVISISRSAERHHSADRDHRDS